VFELPPPQATNEAEAPSAAMEAVCERNLRLETFAIVFPYDCYKFVLDQRKIFSGLYVNVMTPSRS